MPPVALPDPPLTDGVITLREPLAEDCDAVVAAFRDPEIPRWTSVPSPYRPADHRDWLRRQAEQRAEGSALSLMVVDPAGTIVGGVGLHGLDSDRPDIGYWIAREHRGRGHAARAVRLVRSHAAELGIRRVDLLIQPDNRASIRVALSAGFTQTGEVVECPRDAARRPHLRFAWPSAGDGRREGG